MSTIALWFSRVGLALAVAAGMFSPTPAQANAPNPVPSVLLATPAPSNDRLQRAWEREQAIYTRLGRLFDHADERLARAQLLIDKARSNGKDVAALQGNLDALSAAIKEARPIYEGGKAIIASHQGFDASGSVVDSDQARQAVLDLRARLREIRDIVGGPGKALREAIRAFREANHPAMTPTPTEAGG